MRSKEASNLRSKYTSKQRSKRTSNERSNESSKKIQKKKTLNETDKIPKDKNFIQISEDIKFYSEDSENSGEQRSVTIP